MQYIKKYCGHCKAERRFKLDKSSKFKDIFSCNGCGAIFINEKSDTDKNYELKSTNNSSKNINSKYKI